MIGGCGTGGCGNGGGICPPIGLGGLSPGPQLPASKITAAGITKQPTTAKRMVRGVQAQ